MPAKFEEAKILKPPPALLNTNIHLENYTNRLPPKTKLIKLPWARVHNRGQSEKAPKRINYF